MALECHECKVFVGAIAAAKKTAGPALAETQRSLMLQALLVDYIPEMREDLARSTSKC